MLSEAVSSLYGACRLARLDAAGMAYFPASAAGAWRSFAAMFAVAPMYAALLAFVYPLIDPPPSALRFAIVEAEAYVISWFAYPLLIAWLAGRIGRLHRFPAYLSAYNWSMILVNGVVIPINMLQIGGVFVPGAGDLLWLAAISLILFYLGFIARTALEVPPLTAAAIVATDVTLNIAISVMAKRLY